MSQYTEITMSVGSSLSFSDTSGGSYATVAGVRMYKWAGKRPSADASCLADSVQVKKPKRIDGGTITFTVIYGKTQFLALLTLFNLPAATAQKYWKLTDADGSVMGPFFGHVSDLSKDTPDDDPVTSEMSIDVSGQGGATGLATFTPAS